MTQQDRTVILEKIRGLDEKFIQHLDGARGFGDEIYYDEANKALQCWRELRAIAIQLVNKDSEIRE